MKAILHLRGKNRIRAKDTGLKYRLDGNLQTRIVTRAIATKWHSLSVHTYLITGSLVKCTGGRIIPFSSDSVFGNPGVFTVYDSRTLAISERSSLLSSSNIRWSSRQRCLKYQQEKWTKWPLGDVVVIFTHWPYEIRNKFQMSTFQTKFSD